MCSDAVARCALHALFAPLRAQARRQASGAGSSGARERQIVPVRLQTASSTPTLIAYGGRRSDRGTWLHQIKMRLILCHVALVRALHSSQRVLKRRDLGAIAAAAALGTRAPPAVAVPPACDDAVAVWSNGNRQVYIVGTAHVSEKSAELVAQTIDAVQPTLVMLELDRKRLKGAPAAASSASTPQPPRRPSLLERTGAWVVGSLLSGLYKSLDDLGLNSGREFSVALTKARENNIQILLADRDVDETLRRLSAAIQQTTSQSGAQIIALPNSLDRFLRRSQDFERFEALATTISGIAEPVDLGDKNSVTGAIETIKTRSTVKELVKDLRESLPNIYSALVDERDEYMTQSLLSRLSEQPRSAPQRVVAVVGLAHEDGINRRLAKAGYAAAPAPPRRLCQAA